MTDELPIADRAQYAQRVLDERGYLVLRNMIDRVPLEQLRGMVNRFLSVAKHLDLEAQQLEDGTIVAWPKNSPRPDADLVERRLNAHLN